MHDLIRFAVFAFIPLAVPSSDSALITNLFTATKSPISNPIPTTQRQLAPPSIALKTYATVDNALWEVP